MSAAGDTETPGRPAEGAFDFIVAGGGSAGCVLARRLAEDGAARVLLIEAGPARESLFSRMPAGNGFLFGDPKRDWGFWSEPQAGLDGRRLYYPRGKGLGGSSILNGMIYIRGAAADFDGWAAAGLDGWGYAALLPYFKRAEGARHRRPPYHGCDGPLGVTRVGEGSEIDARFLAAAAAAGAPLNADFNAGDQRGVGLLDATLDRGRRQSTAASYLRKTPRGLTVLAGAMVDRVVIERGRAVGVVVVQGRRRRWFRAEREVTLALGAFGSPLALMRSGVGPAAHLRAMGVRVLRDAPGVGSGLADHPNLPVQFALTRPELSLARHQRLDRAAVLGLRYLLTRSGPGAAPFWSSLMFHGGAAADPPAFETFFTPMAVRETAREAGGWSVDALLNIGRLFLARGEEAAPGVQFDINLLRPRSRGTVRLRAQDPHAPPRIDPGYFAEPADLAALETAFLDILAVAAEAPLATVLSGRLSPRPADGPALRQEIRALTTTGHHPVATCRMGPDGDPGAVLDGALRVRGVDALRVVDASSFFDQIGGNPNAAVIALAEKAADLMRGRAPLPPETPEPVERPTLSAV